MAAAVRRQVNLVTIRQMELDFFTKNLFNIGTSAALFSGHSWSGVIQIAIPDAKPDNLKMVYMFFTYLSMVMHLFVVVSARPHPERTWLRREPPRGREARILPLLYVRAHATACDVCPRRSLHRLWQRCSGQD